MPAELLLLVRSKAVAHACLEPVLIFNMAGLEGLGDAVDEVFREIRAKMKEASQHAGIIESLQAFIAAVDWKVRDGLCYLTFALSLKIGKLISPLNCGRSHGSSASLFCKHCSSCLSLSFASLPGLV